MENVSVEAALKKAIRIRNITALIIIPYFLPFGIYLTLEGYSGTVALTGAALCFVFCFIVGFFYNKTAMAHWRIWAFTNVRNVHELRDSAAQYMFVPKSKLHFRTEFPSASFKQKWEALQYKFDTPDEIVEDMTLPDMIVIPVNRAQHYKNLQFFSKNKMLKISCEGIEIDNEKLYDWDNITDISFDRVFLKSDQTGIALCLQLGTEKKIVLLANYKTNRYQLNNIIRTFRIRHSRRLK